MLPLRSPLIEGFLAKGFCFFLGGGEGLGFRVPDSAFLRTKAS